MKGSARAKPESKGSAIPGQKGAMKPKGKLIPIYRRLLQYVLMYRRSMLLITVGFLFSSLLSLTPALIVKQALDHRQWSATASTNG